LDNKCFQTIVDGVKDEFVRIRGDQQQARRKQAIVALLKQYLDQMMSIASFAGDDEKDEEPTDIKNY